VLFDNSHRITKTIGFMREGGLLALNFNDDNESPALHCVHSQRGASGGRVDWMLRQHGFRQKLEHCTYTVVCSLLRKDPCTDNLQNFEILDFHFKR
jgi:hypothetical protein